MSSTTARFDPEPERYEFSAAPFHHFDLARRDFFKVLGAGIAVFAVAKQARASMQETAPTRGFHSEELPDAITAWLHVGEDGTVTAFTGKVEIGQNIRTSLAQTVADELHVPFDSVRMVTADTALTPFDFGTVGSRSMPTMSPQLRRVANAARELLVQAAAKEWNVSPEKLTAADGKVTDPSSGRSLRYSELARGNTLAQTLPADDPVTPPDKWTIAGRPIPKKNARSFVTGEHKYTPDLSRPGMLYGKVLRPPSFGATVTSYDAAKAQAMNGVKVVRDGDFIGAVAGSELAAQKAVEAIHAEWKQEPQISSKELFSHLKKNAKPGTDGRSRRTKGSMEEGLSGAAHTLESTHNVAFIAHAPLEPRAALAEWSPEGKLTVWTGSQRPFAIRDELASVFHISDKDVRVIVPDTGSAYGGKHAGDAALEAARLARAAGKPVKVVWTREEEFTWAYFRPAGVIEIKSGIAADGSLTAWEFHNYNSGMSAIDTPYTAANQHIEFHSTQCPLRSGSYRGLAATANFFARESHMDALARVAQMDPLEFRLKNLSDDRLRAVLRAAANSFGWPAKKVKEGQGFGLACGVEKGGYVATCAEVAADRSSGTVRVARLTTAFECGAIVNPDGLRNQVVGANIQGLGGALFEAIEFENGRITNPRFSGYHVPRFRDVPEVEAVLIDRKDIASAGAGETPIMAVAPAVGNAIFDATGIRISDLPMIPKGLPEAKT